jgi:hypothetical protein
MAKFSTGKDGARCAASAGEDAHTTAGETPARQGASLLGLGGACAGEDARTTAGETRALLQTRGATRETGATEETGGVREAGSELCGGAKARRALRVRAGRS